MWCRLLDGLSSSMGSGKLTELCGADSWALPNEAVSTQDEMYFLK